MSKENALAFLSKVSQDQGFADKVGATSTEDGWVKLANDAGLDCTAAEIKEAGKLVKNQGGELSDEDLESVAGGAKFSLSGFKISYNRFSSPSLSSFSSIMYW